MLPIKKLVLPLCLVWLVSGCATTSKAEQEQQAQAQSEEVVGKAQKKMISNGDTAARSRDYQAAVAFYREALRLKETASLWLRVGFAYQGLENARNAAGAFQKAIALDAEDPTGWQALGKLYLNNRELDLAREHYQHALTLNPGLWQSHSGLGIVEDLAGNGALGRDHYLKALDLEHNSPQLWTNFGYSHYLSGNYEEAEKAFKQALILDSDYKPAWANYGLVTARLGNYSEAIKHLMRVQKEAVAYNDIGYIAMLNGDLAQAEHLLNRAVEMSPSHYEQAQENLKQLRAQRSSARLQSLAQEKQPPKTTQPNNRDSQKNSKEEGVGKAAHPGKADAVNAPSSAAAQRLNAEKSLANIAPDLASTPAPVSLPPLQVARRKATPSSNELVEVGPKHSGITLSTCPRTKWPSACRLCLSLADPDECFAEALQARNSYRPRD